MYAISVENNRVVLLSLCIYDAKVRAPSVAILAAVMTHCLWEGDTGAMLCRQDRGTWKCVRVPKVTCVQKSGCLPQVRDLCWLQ